MKNYINCTTNIDELVDIRSVKIDTSLPLLDRKESYYKQIGNPQCFRYGDITVRVFHMDTGISFEERMKQLMLSGQGMDLIL